MTTTPTLPKKRIEVIDALRGLALMGIMFIHCLEHFDALPYSGEAGHIVEPVERSEDLRGRILVFSTGQVYDMRLLSL